jgi:hypothetical protein
MFPTRLVASHRILALAIFLSIVPVFAQEPAPNKEDPRKDPSKDQSGKVLTPEEEEVQRKLKQALKPGNEPPAYPLAGFTGIPVHPAPDKAPIRVTPNPPARSLEYSSRRPSKVALGALDAVRISAWTPSSPGKVLDLDAVAEELKLGRTIVSTGAQPSDSEWGQQWRDLKKKYPSQFIIHEPESANNDKVSISAAIALGDKPIDPAKVKIFNALPQAQDIYNFSIEQNRMLIGGTPESWRTLNEQIKQRSEGFGDVRVATKKELLEELRSGTSDTIIVYAHLANGDIYLPTPVYPLDQTDLFGEANGERISIEEFEQVVRNDSGAKNRVIILAACDAGSRTEETRALTSVMLQNRHAGAVWAIDRPFDAKLIPELMKAVKSGQTLRLALAQVHLQQYVEVRFPTYPLLDFELTAISARFNGE